jgi:hypothetical protein
MHMRQEPEFFGEKELNLLYMGRKLRASLKVEKILNEGGIDYAVEPGYYQSGLLFRSTKIGAYFYVLPEDEARARMLLLEGGYKIFDGETVQGKLIK